MTAKRFRERGILASSCIRTVKIYDLIRDSLITMLSYNNHKLFLTDFVLILACFPEVAFICSAKYLV